MIKLLKKMFASKSTKNIDEELASLSMSQRS